MTEPKPCPRKGCKAKTQHHHEKVGKGTQPCLGGTRCAGETILQYAESYAPRLSRNALVARLAAVEAECADLHAEIADKADRLARWELPKGVKWSALDVYKGVKRIGFVLVGATYFIGYNFDLNDNGQAGIRDTLEDAVTHVRKRYATARKAAQVAEA